MNAKIGAVTVGGYGFYFNMRQFPVGVSTNGTAYGHRQLDSNQMPDVVVGTLCRREDGPGGYEF